MFMNQSLQTNIGNRNNEEAVRRNSARVFFALAGLLLFATEASAVSAIFTGLNTFATAVISILGAAVIVGLVVLLIVSLGQGQVNWGPILFGLLAVVLIAGIAANVNGFLAALGINIAASGIGYSELQTVIR